MSCIVYTKNKKTGVIYAYESQSYRDPVTKKPKSKRKYLGRVDPETKLIIPKAEEGKRNRTKSSESYGMLPDETVNEINALRAQVRMLQVQVNDLEKKNHDKEELILKMSDLLKPYI